MTFKDLLSSKSLFLHVSNCVHRMPGCQWIPKISLDFGVVLQSLVGSRRKNRLVGGDGVFVREFSSLQMARRDANEITLVILVSTAP